MTDTPLTRALLIVASVIVIIAGLKAAQTIVMPTLVAVFLAVLATPAVTTLVKLRVPVGISVTTVVCLLFGFLFALGSLVSTSADEFVTRLPVYEAQLADWLTKIESTLPWLVADVRTAITEFRPDENVLSVIGRLFSGLGSLLTALVLIIFTLIFALLEGQNAPGKIKLIMGEENSIAYFRKFSKLVQRYLLVKSLISLATGMLIAFLLWIIGVDYPILWGTIAFVLNFIPNVGSLLASIPPVILGTIQFGLTGFVLTGATYIAVNTIIGNLVEPRAMGKTLDISPLVVFLSLVFWGWVLGPIGMLLSIPLTVVVKIGLEVHPNTQWLAKVLSQ